MPATESVRVLSSQPDIRLLERLTIINRMCLAVVALIALMMLGGAFSRTIAALLPEGEAGMRASTALGMLLAVASLALAGPRSGDWGQRVAAVFALAVFAIAGTTLSAYAGGPPGVLDRLVAIAPASADNGSMSFPTSIYLTILGLTLVFVRARNRAGAIAVDLLTVGLVISLLIIIAGYCFDAIHLFGQSRLIHTASQTLGCLVLLTFVTIGRRSEFGYFSVLVGIGIGSQIVRIMLPITIILPFLLTLGGAYTTLSGWLTPPYARAVTAAAMAFVFCVLLVVMAWRINALERDLRDMSLTDALTGCYNRRGFGILSTQALHDARRAGEPLSVLFFDVDDLKKVNDRLGHDAGSRILMDVGRLLRRTFRGADVVARVGGDEFAVVLQGDQHAGDTALARLNDKTRVMNNDGRHPYKIAYSVGMATSVDNESLDKLITRADAVMYEHKRSRKADRDQAPLAAPEQPASILADG